MVYSSEQAQKHAASAQAAADRGTWGGLAKAARGGWRRDLNPILV